MECSDCGGIRRNPICPDCGTKYEEELVHSWICGHLKELKRLADEGDEEAKSELISKSIKFQIPTYLLKSGSPWKGWADTLFNEDMRIRYAAVALGLSRACTCGSGLPWNRVKGLALLISGIIADRFAIIYYAIIPRND